MVTTTTGSVRPERIASYETLEGAARAASHLVELQYDPEEIAIVPRDFEVARPSVCHRMASGARTGAIVAALTTATVAVIAAAGLESLIRPVLPAVAVGALGALVGIMVAFTRHRHEARAALGIPREDLIARSFDVVVTHSVGSARHDLASWWSPDARPVSRLPEV